MVVGQIGVPGQHALQLVEEDHKHEFVNVTIQHHKMEGKIVLEAIWEIKHVILTLVRKKMLAKM